MFATRPPCALTYQPLLAALPPRPGLYAGDDARSALVATHATHPTTTRTGVLVSDTFPKAGVGSDAASPNPTTATTRHQLTRHEEALLKRLMADHQRAMDQAFVDRMFGTTTDTEETPWQD